MASDSASLALKAAAVAAVLAVLVLPSSARSPSLGAELVRAPAPTPAVKCNCSYCIPRCDASVPVKCSQYCGASSCDDCKSREIKKCRDGCKGSSCAAGCVKDANMACGGICYGGTCSDCMRQTSKQCLADCNVDCEAGCRRIG